MTTNKDVKYFDFNDFDEEKTNFKLFEFSTFNKNNKEFIQVTEFIGESKLIFEFPIELEKANKIENNKIISTQYLLNLVEDIKYFDNKIKFRLKYIKDNSLRIEFIRDDNDFNESFELFRFYETFYLDPNQGDHKLYIVSMRLFQFFTIFYHIFNIPKEKIAKNYLYHVFQPREIVEFEGNIIKIIESLKTPISDLIDYRPVADYESKFSNTIFYKNKFINLDTFKEDKDIIAEFHKEFISYNLT